MTNVFPTGTVTFLFTDIEGSTGIAQAYPVQWESLRGRHHEILRSAIKSNHGYVFQIVGDEFCCAFHTAPDALCAAVAAQKALQSEAWHPVPLKVRMGINTGAAQVADVTADYGGYTGYATLARVNRVMSAGHGGQILLSASSASLTCGELPENVTLRDMGEQRLKGLLNPEHLWQVDAPGLVHDFPPLNTLNAIPNNLPTQLTNFIGREKEIAEVKDELKSHRLVTLVGPGGTGKSRLSLQVAADVLDAYPHGVWFIELAALSDPELIPQTILSTISVSEQKGQTALETLKQYLHGKNLLLILDNCEHLIEACAQATEFIVKAAPHVKILASSRESLGLHGEVVWHVPSLSLPNPKNLPEPEQLTQYESVQLFIDRVLLVSPHFAINRENAAAVAQICYRLDGIPLALELAAARTRSISVEQIMARLDDRFRLLTGGSRTALPRQQTLRALIDWSYDLLTDTEKLLFRRLAVFSGGWTLELAEQICAGEKLDACDVLDLLTHLVDKSLVAVEENRSALRYHILETVRQYAREKLFESGESTQMRNHHLNAFVKWVEHADSELKKDEAKKWFKNVDSEQDNIRAAIWWALENKNTSLAMRVCMALDYYWDSRELNAEATNLCDETLKIVEQDQSLLGSADYAFLLAERIIHAVSVKRDLATDPMVFETATKAALLAEQLKFPPGSRRIFWLLSWLYTIRDELETAEQTMLKALKGARAAGHQEDAAWELSILADIYWRAGDKQKSDAMDAESRDIFLKIGQSQLALNQADALTMKEGLVGDLRIVRKNLEKSLRVYQELGHDPKAENTLSILANIAYMMGDYEQAQKYYGEVEAYARKSGNQVSAKIRILQYKGEFALVMGDLENARQYFETAIKLMKENQAEEFSGEMLEHYGLVLLHLGRLDEARGCFERGSAQMEKVGQMQDTHTSWYGLGELERIVGNVSISKKNYQRAFFLCRQTLFYTFYPRLFVGLAKLALLEDEPIQSARWFGCADGLRQKFGIALIPVDRPDYDKHVELLKSKLDTQEFESAWGEGASLDMEAGVALALQCYEVEK